MSTTTLGSTSRGEIELNASNNSTKKLSLRSSGRFQRYDTIENELTGGRSSLSHPWMQYSEEPFRFGSNDFIDIIGTGVGSGVFSSHWQQEKRLKLPLLFDVPPAIPRIKKTFADLEFEKKKIALAHRLPVLNFQQIARLRLPHHKLVTSALAELGFHKVVTELAFLLKKDKILATNRHRCGLEYSKLSENPELFDTIADNLQQADEFVQKKQYMGAIGVRKILAEDILTSEAEDKNWIAKHLYLSCLNLAKEIQKGGDAEVASKLTCEIKCILGYLEIHEMDENGEHLNGFSMRKAIHLIEKSREMSNGEDWVMELLERNILIIKLMKPVCMVGLREDYEIIDGHSMSLHSVATLLLYEIFHLRASAAVYEHKSKKLRVDSLDTALNHATQALKFANEIHDNVALNSAYMVLGEVNRKIGNFDRAKEIFTDLLNHANFQQDHETAAIAYNSIGRCMGCQDPINALENFVCQKEVAELHNLPDLELDALCHIGQCLLEEGSLVEAELCFMEAHHGFQNLYPQPPNFVDIDTNSWINAGISAGLNMWGRFAGHCRIGFGIENRKCMEGLNNWKSLRYALQPLRRHPSPKIQSLFEVFPKLEPGKYKVPIYDTDSPLLTLFRMSKAVNADTTFRDAIVKEVSDGTDPNSVQSLLKITKEVRITTSGTVNKVLVTARNSGNIVTWKDLNGDDEEYDEGEPIIYESDLRSWVRKSGQYYWLGQKKYKIITRRETQRRRRRASSVSIIGGTSSYKRLNQKQSSMKRKLLQSMFSKTETSTIPKTLDILLAPVDVDREDYSTYPYEITDKTRCKSLSEFERDQGLFRKMNKSHHGGISRMIERASATFKSILRRRTNYNEQLQKSLSEKITRTEINITMKPTNVVTLNRRFEPKRVLSAANFQ